MSVHATARIARGVQSAHTASSHVQALVSCKGTINIETDSVRKYTEDKHKHSKSKPGERKHGKEDKGAGHSNKKSKSKSKHKKTT